MPRIMIVDDDKTSLKSLHRIVSSIEDSEVAAFLSVHDALEYAERHSCDLVISDYRMPEMDGIAFLKRLKGLQPGTPRMILSGLCDKQSLYGAINEANALRYIEKPCDPRALRGIISDVLEDYRQKGFSTVRDLLRVIRDMETVIREQERQITDLKIQIKNSEGDNAACKLGERI